MTTPVPLEILKRELLPGETVEWTGRPNPSVTFHQEDWFVVPFMLLWGGFMIFGFLAALGIGGEWENTPKGTPHYFALIWMTPCVLLGQYMIWGRFLYSRWEKKRTYYALTNRRALIVRIGASSQSSSNAYFENLPIVDKRVRYDGIGSIGFGSLISPEWHAGKGDRPPRPLTFEDVDGVDSVYQHVIRLRDQAHKSGDKALSRLA